VQLQEFLDTEANIPEEYLVSGYLGNNLATADNQQFWDVEPAAVVAPAPVGVDPEVDRPPLQVAAVDAETLTVGDETRYLVRRRDVHGGVVLLDRDALEVKEHRRIHKKYSNKFAMCMLAEVKIKFGTPKRNKANVLSIRRYLAQLMKQRGVRAVDQARVIHYVVAAAFIPSEDEIAANVWLNTDIAQSRLSGWTYDEQQ
jgi:hypothetical protein